MEIKEEIRTVRYIEYDGKRFYEDSKGYWLGQEKGPDGKPHRIRLHTYVWEKFNGPVPDGYDIHHIDHDPSNNDIENLVALPESEHHKLHMEERDKLELTYIMETLARPKAIKWHQSEAGKGWHKQQYEKTIAPHWEENVTLICEQCGKPYQVSSLMRDRSRFCSNKCKSAYRYHSGADNVERTCPICGKTFTINKYSRTKTCSKECGIKLMAQSKTGVSHRKP